MHNNHNGKALPAEAPRRNVLLLDDDEDLCDVLRSLLEWHHYDVAVVHRGVEGVHKIIARDFDAIICDIMMPKMPGDMFYVAVQHLKPHLCRRFIFITAHQGSPKVDAFLQVSAGLVLYKPLATDELIAKIAFLIAATDAMEKKSPSFSKQTPLTPRRTSQF